MTCGKVPYRTRKIAKKALRTINQNNPSYHLKNVYYCEDCSAWHTTSTPRAIAKQIKRKKP